MEDAHGQAINDFVFEALVEESFAGFLTSLWQLFGHVPEQPEEFRWLEAEVLGATFPVLAADLLAGVFAADLHCQLGLVRRDPVGVGEGA